MSASDRRHGPTGIEGEDGAPRVVCVGGEKIRWEIWEAARRSTENEPPLLDAVVIEFVRLMDELATKHR
jgi:hypothetical protein